MPYLGNEVAPLVQALEGKELKLDNDGDSSITADTDDRVDVKVGGSDKVHVTATGLGVGTNSPDEILHLKTTADADLGLKVQNDDTQAFCKVQSGGTALYGGNGGVNFVSGSSFATAMNIDANGHVTMPKQPGWFATANDNTVLTNGGFTQPLLKNELWDNGSDYDASSSGTHRFTAPVAGKYLVTAGIGIVSNGLTSSRLLISIWKNDYLHQYVGSNYSAGAQPYTTNGSTLVDLSANDYLRMLIQVDGGNKNTDFRTDQQYLATFFGGYLLG